MFYRDLVQFEALETVVQLRDADQVGEAERLVKSYVISDRMADQLVNLVLPNLQFQTPRDNKGVLIIGNYGTGKSHLMAVLSALAEYPETLAFLADERVRTAASPMAGKFKVLRVEIGGVTRSLRDILLDELEHALERWETPYHFPPADQVTNHKNLLIEAVGKFQEKYPGYGILLVVDEMLDYLRSREERALILDLGFMRELGEVAANTPFRFVGGLQESLFDTPRFEFVARQLNRVKDRFEQVRIAREDVAFVVSRRLLRKTDAQLAQVTEHLRPFAHLYRQMSERLDEFARLFPIHPTYIETFEQVTIAEKRHVLKTFSQAIRALLDMEVPTDQPGLVSYDHYWPIVKDDPALRSIPGIARVIEKSNVLEGRIRNAYTRPNLLPVALRIIQALSVQRLTKSDINVPLGVTAEELRDGLCLHMRLPEQTDEFLLDQVKVALREIMRTVQGQFISFNEDNGQYYLDLQKVVDFDAKIAERGEAIDRPDLNRYFFDALKQALQLSDTTYINNYNIWFYELPWLEKKVNRPGYLFFGAPDERSTAQPPRDFYIYWLPPFFSRKYHDDQLADEVLFQLTGLDEAFEQKVRLYAGARAMAIESSEYRQAYADKAEEHYRVMLRWLRDNLKDHLRIIHQGVTESVEAVLARTRSSASQTVEELLKLISTTLLAPAFDEKYPDYPNFRRLSQPVSETARPNTAQEAINFICGRGRTNLGLAVLDGLELLDGEQLRPGQSRYARKFLEALQAKPEGQVVNRGELIEIVAGGIVPVEKDLYFHLEPEFVMVVLMALVWNGEIALNVDGRDELDAGSLERALTLSLNTLTDFRFYKAPRSLPINLWAAIFEGLGLKPGLVRDPNTQRQAVEELQRAVNAELERVTTLLDRVQAGLNLWNSPVFTDRYTMVDEGGVIVSSDQPDVLFSITELLSGLRAQKQFLEDLTRYNTIGKLRNLRLTGTQISDAADDRQTVKRAAQLVELVAQIQPVTSYLAEALANLPQNHPWLERAVSARAALLEDVRRLGKGENGGRTAPALLRDMEALKREYIAAYAELHRALVLSPRFDERRVRLYSDSRLAALDQLSAMSLFHSGSAAELEAWKQAAKELPTCREFHEGAIETTPTCPSCRLRPSQRNQAVRAEQTLEILDTRLDDLLKRWRLALRANLGSETARHSLEAMTPSERQPLEAFLTQNDDDPNLPAGFVSAAEKALRGIQALTLSIDDLLAALKTGGLPCTLEELQRRFGDYLRGQMRGRDAGNTRLTLDR